MITTRKLERQRRKYKIAPPRKGDVFTIPLDDGRVYLGQVIAFERFDLLFYIVVFDLVTTPEQASGLVDRALASRPILAGQTMDALFRPGGWKVVGNRPSDAARFLPAYKRDTPQGIFVKDFLATRQRPATPEEAERLPPEHSTSPMIFQMALNSFHGLADHLHYFDTMDPDNIITAREIFGRGLVKSIVKWWGVRRGAVRRGQ